MTSVPHIETANCCVDGVPSSDLCCPGRRGLARALPFAFSLWPRRSRASCLKSSREGSSAVLSDNNVASCIIRCTARLPSSVSSRPGQAWVGLLLPPRLGPYLYSRTARDTVSHRRHSGGSTPLSDESMPQAAGGFGLHYETPWRSRDCRPLTAMRRPTGVCERQPSV